MRKINSAGLALIKEFEGLELGAYQCSAGVWTIGYGHTSDAGAPQVYKGLEITEEEAEDILQTDLRHYEAGALEAGSGLPGLGLVSPRVWQELHLHSMPESIGAATE